MTTLEQIYEKARFNTELVQAATPKYGCLMAMVPALDSTLANWAADNIPASELANDGIETEPHVTVLYGFNLDFDSDKLVKVLATQKPFKIKLGKLSRFECPEYDVLKFEVECLELIALNEKLSAMFSKEIVPSKWDYHPHLTVAYVHKGAMEGFEDSEKQFSGQTFTVQKLLYSLPEKQGRRVIDLGANVKSSLAVELDRIYASAEPEEFKKRVRITGLKDELRVHEKEAMPGVWVDAGIAHHIKKLNDNGFKTWGSDSGLRVDHPFHKDIKSRPYIMFHKSDDRHRNMIRDVASSVGACFHDSKPDWPYHQVDFDGGSDEKMRSNVSDFVNRLTGGNVKSSRLQSLTDRINRVLANEPFKYTPVHPEGDPKAPISGKLKYATVILGDKRLHGKYHSEAYDSAPRSHLKYFAEEGYVKNPDHEGFTTESGHYLTREQAHDYVDKFNTNRVNIKFKTRGLAADGTSGLETVESCGKLYTPNAIQAVSAADYYDVENLQPSQLHESVRQHGETLMRHAVARTMAYAETKAAGTIDPKIDAQERKKKLETEILAVFLLLAVEAERDAYENALTRLGAPLGVEREQVPSGEEKRFLDERRSLLGGFPSDVAKALAGVVSAGIANGLSDSQIRANIALERMKWQQGRGEILAETEAQAIYGSAQLRILKVAGFETCRWQTEGDDKVRPSHRACEAQGEVAIGQKFCNGLRYPGDPSGGASEVCNCRCNLIGGSREEI